MVPNAAKVDPISIYQRSDSKELSTTTRGPSNAAIPFPWKLHRILDDADADGFNDIISWVPTNNGFKVHKTKEFDTTIMPRYFNNTKYKSFQRQLNMWGFDRVGAGPFKGSYLHSCFIRGKPELCESMQRTKIKGIHSKKIRRNQDPLGGAGSNHSRSSMMSIDSTETRRSSIDTHAHIKAAAQKVADLERQREEIQRKLELVSTKANAAAATEALSNMTTMMIPRVSLYSDHEQEAGNSNEEDLNPLPISEGDSLLYGGRNFYFSNDGSLSEEPSGSTQEDRPRRRVARRYSLEPMAPNSDEYVLRQLDGMIGNGSEGFDQRMQYSSSNGESRDSNNFCNNVDILSPTPLAPNHCNFDQVVTATASLPNSNVTSSLEIGFDIPRRRFSFLSTPVVNPLDMPCQGEVRRGANSSESRFSGEGMARTNSNNLITNMNNLIMNSNLRNGPSIRGLMRSNFQNN